MTHPIKTSIFRRLTQVLVSLVMILTIVLSMLHLPTLAQAAALIENNPAKVPASASLIASGSGPATTDCVPPTLSKRFSPNPIIAGQVTTLTFTLTNPNWEALPGAAFTDSLPVGLQVASPAAASTTCPDAVFAPAPGDTSLSFSGGIIPMRSGCTAQVNVIALSAGIFPNTTSPLTTIYPELVGPPASDTLEVDAPNPGLNLTKQVADSPTGPWTSFLVVPPQTGVYYRLTVENTGNVDLSNVFVADPNLDLSTCALSAPFTLTTASPSASCIVGPVTISAGYFLNTATAQGDYLDTRLTDTSSAETYGVPPEPEPSLTFEKLVSTSPAGPWSGLIRGVAPGSQIYYKFILVNSGNVALNGLNISDPDVDTSGCMLTDPLAPEEATTCVVGPVTALPGIYTNIAVAQSTTPELTSLTSDATYIAGSFSISGVVWDDLNADGVINSGEQGLSNVSLALYQDDGDGLFEASEDTFLGNRLTAADGSYSFADLPPGTYFVQVTAGVEGYLLVSGGSNPRLVVLTAGDSPANNFGYRAPQADLRVTKTNGVTSVNVGGTTTYVINVTNDGPDPVSGAILSDVVGAGLSATAVACSVAEGNQCASAPLPLLADLIGAGISLPTLTSGQFYEIELTARVTAISGSVTNTVTVTPPAGTTDPDPENNTASDTDRLLFYLYLPIILKPVPQPLEIPIDLVLGYEDLPLLGGQNDFDYNDWTVAVNGKLTFTSNTADFLQKFSLSFTPRARGGTYDHTFQIRIPAQTFSSNGSIVVNLYDQNRSLTNTRTIPFYSGMDNTVVIFSRTSDVFPGSVINTIEGTPNVAPRQYADLTLTFDAPTPFTYSPDNLSPAHGQGLFFDPTLLVLNNNEQIRRGDVRLLSIPSSTWLWPEESIRVDYAYPLVFYLAGFPPDFLFSAGWWTVHNNCVFNGVPCGTP